MSIAKERSDILVLGGGDGLALREILKYPDVKKITLVDIDPLVVRAATELDFMRALNKNAFFDSRVSVIVGDAFKFVEQLKEGSSYDVIFIDFPDPTDDGLSRLYSKEFYKMLTSAFRENTIAVIQSESYFGLIQKNILTTLGHIGIEVLAYHPPKYDFFDQNFGFSLVCFSGCQKNDFKKISVSVPNTIFQNNNLEDIFSTEPISKYSFYESQVNSIFHPTIFKLIDDVFSQHYMQSRPIKDILNQIKTSPEETKKQFLENFFILPVVSI
jgi:predicted membrane-bound spermidine synthase